MIKKYRALLMMDDGFFSFDAVIDKVFEAEDRESAIEKACIISDDFCKVMDESKNGHWVIFNILTKKLETKIPDNDKYKYVTLKNFEFYDETKGPWHPFPLTGELTMMNPDCFVSLTEKQFCFKLYFDVNVSLMYSDYYNNHDYIWFESTAYGVEEVVE